jgi:hypothetical protein
VRVSPTWGQHQAQVTVAGPSAAGRQVLAAMVLWVAHLRPEEAVPLAVRLLLVAKGLVLARRHLAAMVIWAGHRLQGAVEISKAGQPSVQALHWRFRDSAGCCFLPSQTRLNGQHKWPSLNIRQWLVQRSRRLRHSRRSMQP